MKLAVIAHDGKKAEMVAFLNRHMDFFKSVGVDIVATGTTGKHAQEPAWKLNGYYPDRWAEMPRLPHKLPSTKSRW